MKITQLHYEFWCQRNSKVSWWPIKTSKVKMISVHQLIPMDNPNRDPRIHDPKRITVQNLLTSHPDLTKLYHRMLRPGTVIRPYRISGYCNKWLTKVYVERLTFLRSIDIEVYEAEIEKTKSMLKFLIGYKRTIQNDYRKEHRSHRSK